MRSSSRGTNRKRPPIIWVDKLTSCFRDIQVRVSLWHSLTELGYTYPRREPLLKSELLEEERARKAIMNARALAEEDTDVPCRAIRVLVGFKSSDDVDLYSGEGEETYHDLY